MTKQVIKSNPINPVPPDKPTSVFCLLYHGTTFSVEKLVEMLQGHARSTRF